MTSRHNSLRLYQPTNSTPDELTEQQLALFTLLQLREQEFGFNPNVIVHYPEAGFLGSPISESADWRTVATGLLHQSGGYPHHLSGIELPTHASRLSA